MGFVGLAFAVLAGFLGTGCTGASKAKDVAVAARETVGEAQMSAELREFRTRFQGLKTKGEIEQALTELETGYEGYPADLKLVAAQIIPLRSYRSVVFRLAPLFESSAAARPVSLVAVVQAVAAMRRFFPAERWDAGVAYVTEPLEGVPTERFTSVAAFQEYLVGTVYPQVKLAADRLERIDVSAGVVFDNELLQGAPAPGTPLDRYVLVGAAEKSALLSGIHARLHDLLVFSAYDMSALPSLLQKIGHLPGITAFGPPTGQIEGFSAAQRAEAIRQPEFARMLTLLPAGAQHLTQALEHLRIAVSQARESWAILRDRPASAYNVLNAARDLPWPRPDDRSMRDLEAMTAGPAEIRSASTGEPAAVDVPKLYTHPPVDLKAFLPSSFEEGPKFRNVGETEFRNYLWGRATGWDAAAYEPYLQTKKDGSTVGDAILILRQSWNGGFINLPLLMLAE